MSDSYEKEQLITTSIQIDSKDVYKTKNIDGLIKFKIKNEFENICSKNGYVVKDSVSIIKRSIGKTTIHNNQSKIEYDITIKMKLISPCQGEIYTTIIDSITKMGIISYMNMKDDSLNNVNDSPVLFIIPKEYISDDISSYSVKQKIDIEVVQKRIKYRSKQIQVVGKINK